MKKVFIDGSAGTTGLRIFDRLQARSDIQLLTLPEAERKDEGRRRQLLNEADVAFLCLPDAAAVPLQGHLGGRALLRADLQRAGGLRHRL